jgi:hypothetical protein
MLPRLVFAAALAVLPFAGHAAEAPVSVMIVGDFHMSNPGRDLHNVQADDMTAPKRQGEIAAVTTALARFHPTLVAAEWPADIVAQRYAQYAAGTYPVSHNEVVQLGFRLAKDTGARMAGIDVDGDFPYDAVEAYAKAHGEEDILTAINADVQTAVEKQDSLLKQGSVADVLRWLNDPANLAHGNDFYRMTLKIGDGKDQPGADLLTAWYARNFRICANLVQAAKPGDHVVVFYGSGHAFLLRQCVAEMPGYRLVEPDEYLQR